MNPLSIFPIKKAETIKLINEIRLNRQIAYCHESTHDIIHHTIKPSKIIKETKIKL